MNTPSSETKSADEEEALVAFFRGLTLSARREYDALAERDRRFGEDVEAEASAPPPVEPDLR